MNEELRRENWNAIAEELDNVGINIDQDVIDEIVSGNQPPIDKLFSRIERYMKIIAGADFLKFENLLPEDLIDNGEDDEQALMQQVTDVDISELIGLRQNTQLQSSTRVKQADFLPPGISLPEAQETFDMDAEVFGEKE